MAGVLRRRTRRGDGEFHEQSWVFGWWAFPSSLPQRERTMGVLLKGLFIRVSNIAAPSESKLRHP